MVYIKYAYIGNGFRIIRPQGDIEIIIKKVYGTKQNRYGLVEIRGSPFINGLVELTQEEERKLALDISIKVADSIASASKLTLYFRNRSRYSIELIK